MDLIIPMYLRRCFMNCEKNYFYKPRIYVKLYSEEWRERLTTVRTVLSSELTYDVRRGVERANFAFQPHGLRV